MAGSAINLGGMLSQMGNSMGSMGQTVGQGMFQPMLDRQVMEKKQEMILESEARAERRQVEGEKRRNTLALESQVAAEQRREATAERARLEQLGRDQAKVGAMQGPSMAAATAIDNDDPVALRAAIESMTEVGLQYPSTGASEEAARLQGLLGDVRGKSAMNELKKIDRVLNNKEATAALPESEKLAMQERKSALLSDGEVNTLYGTYNAALDKQTDETIKRKIELRKKEAEARELETTTAVNNYATAVIAGNAPLANVPAEYKAGVTKAVKMHKENEVAMAEITDHTQPLSKEVVDWAANDPNVSKIVSSLAQSIQDGTVLNPISARKQIAKAYGEHNSYQRDLKRKSAENASKLASVIRVEETLKHSESWGLGVDVLEELQEVDVADRKDDPLWNMMAQISEANPNLSGRKLAEKLIAARPKDSGKFEEKSIDLSAGEKVVSASMQLPKVQAWREKNPEVYNALEAEIAKEASQFVQHRKAMEAGKQTGRNDEDYSKPFAESKALRRILLSYNLDKV